MTFASRVNSTVKLNCKASSTAAVLLGQRTWQLLPTRYRPQLLLLVVLLLVVLLTPVWLLPVLLALEPAEVLLLELFRGLLLLLIPALLLLLVPAVAVACRVGSAVPAEALLLLLLLMRVVPTMCPVRSVTAAATAAAH